MGGFVAPMTGHIDAALGTRTPGGEKKKMAGKTKSVDGTEHPASDFAYVGDPEKTDTWHLPDFDAKHAKLATEMFGRTEGMSDPKKKAAAAARIARKAKAHGTDTANFEKAHGVKMSDFQNQWVEIFHVGDYGDKGVWTPEMMQQVVANFSAGIWTPPAVFGHPEEDDPAHGWVSELKYEDGTLKARFTQVSDELESSAKSGRFPNRSAAFYRDPKGSGPVLRHVGFLGATPPEVKGLEPISFSDAAFVDIEFSEEEIVDANEMNKTVKDTVKEFFAELFKGVAGSNRDAATFTEDQVQDRIAKAATEIETRLSAKFDERVKKAETLLASSGENALRAKAQAFVQKMKAANKWVPAFSEAGLDAVLENLAVSGAAIKFGEAGKETEATCFDQLCKFLESQKQIVPTGALTVRNAKGRSKVVQFNEARGIGVDMNSAVVNERAEEVMKEEKISFGEALRKARHEMAAEGGALPGGIAAGQA